MHYLSCLEVGRNVVEMSEDAIIMVDSSLTFTYFYIYIFLYFSVCRQFSLGVDSCFFSLSPAFIQ